MNENKISTNNIKSKLTSLISSGVEVIKQFLGIFGYFLFFILGYLFLLIFVVGMMQEAVNTHWSLAFLVIAFYIFVVIQSLGELRFDAKNYPLEKVLGIFSLTVLTAALAFAALSFLLTSFGWAEYESKDPADLFSFFGYYLWLFLELIPGLKLNETLGFVAPLQPNGLVSGLPILAFKVLIIFGLLKALSPWWQHRNSSKNNDSPQNDDWEKVIRAEVDKFSHAFEEANVEALETMLADDYIHVNGLSGAVLSRNEWLNWMKTRKRELENNELIISDYRLEDVEVRVHENVAIVTGLAHSSGKQKGDSFTSQVRFSDTWILLDGVWQRIAFHDSSLHNSDN